MVVVQGFPLILRSPRFENLFGYYGVPPVNPCKRVDGRFAFKVFMTNSKTDDSLETSNGSRSLSIALGVQDYLFIAGIILLSSGVTLVFGWVWMLIVLGSVFVVTGWLMNFAE